MTKGEVLTQVATRLGDNTTDFKTNVLDGIFDQVMAEMAMRDAIRPIRKATTFALSESVGTYDTKTAVVGGSEYPVDIISLNVPKWGPTGGILERIDEEKLLRLKSLRTDSDGVVTEGQPSAWCLTPNEQTLEVTPVPDSDAAGTIVNVIYLDKPTVLTTNDQITEVHREFIPVIIAGCLKYGSVFQDETLIDRNLAALDFENGIRRMKMYGKKERRRDMRVRARD